MDRQRWTYKKLGEVSVMITDGSHFSPKEDSSGNYPMLSVKDMTPAGFDYSTCKYINEEDYRILVQNGCKPKVNDVLVAKDGSYLKTSFVIKREVEQAILSSIAIIRPNIEIVIPEYVSKYMCSPKTKDIIGRHYITGTAIKRIILKGLRNVPVPVPPKGTQTQIVAELDAITDTISLLQEQVKDLDALAQSISYDMFGDPVKNEKGWRIKKLGDLAQIKTGPFGSMLHKEDYVSNGIPLVNPVHMKNYKVVADVDFTITDEKAKELNNYILNTNDIVFARRGDIGRCAVITEKENGYLCGTGSLFVRFEKSLSPIYTMYMVRSTSFTEKLISVAKGATMLNLNSSSIANLLVPVPPYSLQQSFASKVAAIEDAKVSLNAQIKEMQTLLAARMQYWFD